jgi:hypothetical protein
MPVGPGAVRHFPNRGFRGWWWVAISALDSRIQGLTADLPPGLCRRAFGGPRRCCWQSRATCSRGPVRRSPLDPNHGEPEKAEKKLGEVWWFNNIRDVGSTVIQN